MPNLLAIETSTEFCSAAVMRGPDMFVRRAHAGQGHSGLILEMVRAVLDEAGLALKDCSAIAFGAGPGSFTGLRIACSVAQGLAYGADLPVIPVSSLIAIAEQVRAQNLQPAAVATTIGLTVLSALDARMGEVYWSVLEWRDDEWRERVVPSLDFPALIAQRLQEAGLDEHRFDYGCGSAMRIFPTELLPLVEQVSTVDVPDAEWIAGLAARAWLCGQTLPAHEAAPLYVRDRVALTTQERADAQTAKSVFTLMPAG